MWARLGSSEEIVVFPGVSINVPTGTQFQFTNDGDETRRHHATLARR